MEIKNPIRQIVRRRKPGRPRQGKGVRVISVSVERQLLTEADALAARLGITRAALISRGLKAVLESRQARSAVKR